MHTILIPSAHIKALLITAAVKDIRFYLNGICFAGNRAMSTDGHRAGIIRMPDCVQGEYIVPSELFAALKLGAKGSISVTFGEDLAVTCSYNGLTVTGKCVNGKFPDMTRVLPRTLSGEVAQFNAEYLGDLAKISKLLCPSEKFHAPTICHNGAYPALVDFLHAGYTHILMPIRAPIRAPKDYTKPTSAPAWAFGE